MSIENSAKILSFPDMASRNRDHKEHSSLKEYPVGYIEKQYVKRKLEYFRNFLEKIEKACLFAQEIENGNGDSALLDCISPIAQNLREEQSEISKQIKIGTEILEKYPSDHTIPLKEGYSSFASGEKTVGASSVLPLSNKNAKGSSAKNENAGKIIFAAPHFEKQRDKRMLKYLLLLHEQLEDAYQLAHDSGDPFRAMDISCDMLPNIESEIERISGKPFH